ncbi:hypothetical protein H0H81_005260 [Sphagnurus paluster]|uniref:F-box domain-containing protein n=1 Tax=Sphagnurus paluster TaxID=117069 RepID=A0A9P7GLP4_9AGAR|nr:hypothetical protein H0H81_005260 [Sphagnurus paluster]
MSILDDPRLQLAELEAEIRRVEALLAKLVQRRVPLKRKINRRYAHMLSLPIELCSEIFTACFPPSSNGPQTPLLLGSVCTAWRNLAWDMPWLWNNLHLYLTRPTPTHVDLLEQWLARSANLPLSIRLTIKLPDPDSDTHTTARLMAALARCSKRWHTIDFDVPLFFPDPALAPSKFPLLASAAIQVAHITSPLNLFLTAPNLHAISLHGFPRNSFNLLWTHITHLRLSPTTVQQCLELLAGAPHLTHCTFEDITRSDVMNPTPVHAPRLQSLAIISFTHTPVSELLDTLVLPCALDLAFHVTGNTFPYWSFAALIARSGCRPRRLALTAVRISEWQLWECLQAVPSLLALRLAHIDRLTNETLRALNPTAAHPLLPVLHEFHYTGPLVPDLPTLTNTLCARWTGTAPLQKFTFTTSASAPGPTGDVHQARIRALVEDGMDVSIVTREGAWI